MERSRIELEYDITQRFKMKTKPRGKKKKLFGIHITEYHWFHGKQDTHIKKYDTAKGRDEAMKHTKNFRWRLKWHKVNWQYSEEENKKCWCKVGNVIYSP